MSRHPGPAGPPVVLVVAKAPAPGTVKTRLCPPATPRQAAEIAAAALLDTMAAVTAVPAATPALALAGDLSVAVRPGRLRRAVRGWTVLTQHGDTLAERLVHAHAEIADRFPGRPVLQIGMDTPQVSARALERALARLADGCDAVLGPARDGGWWALGLADPRQAGVLTGVPTSRPDTGLRTWRALRGRGLRVGRLPVLRDVDSMGDAVVVAGRVPGSRFAAAVSAVVPGVLVMAPVVVGGGSVCLACGWGVGRRARRGPSGLMSTPGTPAHPRRDHPGRGQRMPKKGRDPGGTGSRPFRLLS
ncbi:TIGR04282 family arsenosugar biosynthesis glycosyltransferase [Micromonospora zhanjiangensis]